MELIVCPITKVTDAIWLGNEWDAKSYDMLRTLGITAIIDLTKDDDPPPPGFKFMRLRQNDRAFVEKAKITQFLKWMDDCIEAGDNVLIHCHLGVSRTPSFFIAWLLHKQGANSEMDIRTMWSKHEDAVGALRSIINPHWMLKKSIIEYFGGSMQGSVFGMVDE